MTLFSESIGFLLEKSFPSQKPSASAQKKAPIDSITATVETMPKKSEVTKTTGGGGGGAKSKLKYKKPTLSVTSRPIKGGITKATKAPKKVKTPAPKKQ